MPLPVSHSCVFFFPPHPHPRFCSGKGRHYLLSLAHCVATGLVGKGGGGGGEGEGEGNVSIVVVRSNHLWPDDSGDDRQALLLLWHAYYEHYYASGSYYLPTTFQAFCIMYCQSIDLLNPTPTSVCVMTGKNSCSQWQSITWLRHAGSVSSALWMIGYLWHVLYILFNPIVWCCCAITCVCLCGLLKSQACPCQWPCLLGGCGLRQSIMWRTDVIYVLLWWANRRGWKNPTQLPVPGLQPLLKKTGSMTPF